MYIKIKIGSNKLDEMEKKRQRYQVLLHTKFRFESGFVSYLRKYPDVLACLLKHCLINDAF